MEKKTKKLHGENMVFTPATPSLFSSQFYGKYIQKAGKPKFYGQHSFWHLLTLSALELLNNNVLISLCWYQNYNFPAVLESLQKDRGYWNLCRQVTMKWGGSELRVAACRCAFSCLCFILWLNKSTQLSVLIFSMCYIHATGNKHQYFDPVGFFFLKTRH